MQETLQTTIQMIKTLNIKNKKEYIKIQRNFKVLNTESLKWIAQTRNFRKALKRLKEVA